MVRVGVGGIGRGPFDEPRVAGQHEVTGSFVDAVDMQTCLQCDTADMSAVSHGRHVCCVKQQTCLLCHTADMSAV